MTTVKLEAHGRVAVLRMDNGPANAIGPTLVLDFSAGLTEAEKNFDALVLAGNPKFFSIGLELPVLIHMNRSDMKEFCYQFNRLVHDLFVISLPTVCAAVGHMIAGGAILALTSDYRFAAEGNKKIGLNEIKLGVPVPYLADLALRDIVGERAATHMIYQGNFLSIAEARQTGLIDQMFPGETVEKEALNLAAQLAAQPESAFRAVKAVRTEAIRLRYLAHRESTIEIFLDCWFEEATRKRLIEACATF